MHEIEPFYRWAKLYNCYQDPKSPFFNLSNSGNEYVDTIYGYYIHPLWDNIGSETLYIKVLFCHYGKGFAVIELFGEWNDTLHNDIMFLKRNVVDKMVAQGVKYFVLIAENVFNFHGSDDCYYEEWFEDVEDGWIAILNNRDFVCYEMSKYRLDFYMNYGPHLELDSWRSGNPLQLFDFVHGKISKLLG